MTYLLRLFALVSILFSFMVFAQEDEGADFRFRLNASFVYEAGNVNPIPVRFTMLWNEEEGKIKGIYTDNRFTTSAPLVGTSGPGGRRFNVDFAAPTREVSGLEALVTEPGLINGTTVITVSPQSAAGAALGTYNVPATVATQAVTPPASDDDVQTLCVVGMGALTGFCGEYAGTIEEETDSNNRCRHYINSTSRLTLTSVGELGLIVRPVASIIANRAGLVTERIVHNLGSIPNTPATGAINVTNRNCGPLPGTSFPEDSCQDLNLSGTFSNVAGVRSFDGTYRITSIEDGATCTYRMDLERRDEEVP